MDTNPEAACREKLRIRISFPVKLRSIDAGGEALEIEGVIDNLSTGGLFMRLPRHIAMDARVFAVIRLSRSRDPEAPGARVAIRGVVLRSEQQSDGSCGIAVGFKRYRFL